MHDGVFTADADGVIDGCDSALERMFGYPASQVIGQRPSMLVPALSLGADDGSARRVSADTSDIVGTGNRFEGVRSDGSRFPLQLTVAEMTAEGRPRFVAVVRDTGNRKPAEDQLRHAQKMESLGALAGGVAHEFNNLLNAIGGFAQMALRKADDPERVDRCLRHVITATEQATGLTAKLLAFARRQALEPKLIDIGSVLADLETRLRPLLGRHCLRMDIAAAEAGARVDPEQLSQAILNLARNGCQAMADGGELVIGSRVMDLDPAFVAGFPATRPGRYVAAFVRDDGCGIDDDDLEHIFEPFFTTRPPGKGTGLGLSMVHGMVAQSGGFIDVESEVGAGTTFTIYLPLIAEARGEARCGARETRGGTVLVVEEKRSVRDLARTALEARGHRVLTAADGAKAVARYRRHDGNVDVLLTDVVMAGKNGPALARELLADQPDLKVVFMSGFAEAKLLDRGRLPRQSVILPKPFDPDELCRRVAELLSGDGHREPEREACGAT